MDKPKTTEGNQRVSELDCVEWNNKFSLLVCSADSAQSPNRCQPVDYFQAFEKCNAVNYYHVPAQKIRSIEHKAQIIRTAKSPSSSGARQGSKC